MILTSQGLMSARISPLRLCLAAACLVFMSTAADAQEWTRQLGTSAPDHSFAISADRLGNVFISGGTQGSFSGTSEGHSQAFVAMYSSAGALRWTRQLASSVPGGAVGLGASADGLGHVYISGITDGDLPRLTHQGGYDAFVAKYNSQGARQWTRQFGSTANEADVRVSADILGNVYVSGTTYGNLQGLRAGFQDAFLSKYDSAGTHQWTKQFGSSASEWGFDLSADGLGNVYVTGRTDELFEGMANLWDTFLIKFDSAGTQQWRRQFGSQDMDTSVGVSADGLGNVYIAGTTFGNLGGQNAGSLDSFVIKYDDAGNLKWTRQIGTVDNDSCFGVSADGLGNVYSVINGNLLGTNAGGSDAYITKFDSDGSLVSVLQMGTSTTDIGRGVSADKLGSVYLTGYTAGDLAGPNAGIFDAFLAKHFDQAVPEPHVGMLALAAAGALSEGRRRRRFSA